MYLKFKEFEEKYNMFEAGDHVLLGLSGGADSVCLLFLLRELSKELHLKITAVHINHGLRGQAAWEDENFVRDLCEKLDVDLLVYQEKVGEFASQMKMSVEEAGRYLRRKRFLETMKDRCGDKIALAHHQNDDAETILLNLCRGSGIKGMTGIAPKEGPFVRPLLFVSRQEIESFLAERSISYCTDQTNLEDHYTRNRIRHHVIPYLESEINTEAVAHIQAMAKKLMKVENFLEAETKKYVDHILNSQANKENGFPSSNAEAEKKDVVSHGEDRRVIISGEEWKKIPEIFRSYVAKELLKMVGGAAKDLETVHVEALLSLFGKQVGRSLDLPYHMKARRVYDGVELRQTENRARDGKKKGDVNQSGNVNQNGNGNQLEIALEASQLRGCPLEEAPDFQSRRFPCLNHETFPESDYTKWFDCGTITGALYVRHRQAGDFILVDNDGSRQKLKKFFINEKIPGNLRDKIWLVAEGHEILWVVGYRQSKKYQLSEGTREILEITYAPEGEE